MKKEELFEALGDIDEESIKKAGEYTRPKKNITRWIAPLALCAAAVFLVVFCLPLITKNGKDPGGTEPTVADKPGSGNAGPTGTENVKPTEAKPTEAAPTETPGEGSGAASYAGREYSANILRDMAECPAPVAADMSAEDFLLGDAHWEWWSEHCRGIDSSIGLSASMKSYYRSVMEKVLVSDDNTVCSPINTFFAVAMLAEVSDGNTRQQVLDLLGAADIETLRGNVSTLFHNNYVDTPALKSLPANSIWLNSDLAYNDETLDTLAKQYFVSSFRGKGGSEELNEALRIWTDDNTGGLLSEYTKDMATDPALVMELVSAFYYKAMWSEVFQEGATDKAVFHGTNGDTDVDMMHRSEMTAVYRNDRFSALGMGLTDSGSMYFFLPEEGVDVNTLLTDDEVYSVLASNGYGGSGWTNPLVHMSIPKFKVSCKTDILETLKELGVTDATDPSKADFSKLTDADGVYLGKADHAAMLEIDEEGVTGAAYTDMALCGASMPEDEIDFIVDRPFFFAVTASDGSILFAGIMRNID